MDFNQALETIISLNKEIEAIRILTLQMERHEEGVGKKLKKIFERRLKKME